MVFFFQNKEAFVTAAKDVISNCQSVTHFIRVITSHCLDKQCTVELSLIVEQILTISNQLNIISRSEDFGDGRNTQKCKSSNNNSLEIKVVHFDCYIHKSTKEFASKFSSNSKSKRTHYTE